MNRPDLPSLTGLRFFAAALIVFDHIAGFFLLPAHSRFAEFRHVSYLGMTLFFVLSGFVIHYNYGVTFGSMRGLGNFLVARFARLYPLYLLSLLALAVFQGTPNPQLSLVWLYCFTATHAWFPVKIGDEWLANVAGGSWSISVEIFLYLLYVPASALLSRLSLGAALRTLMALLTGMAIFYAGRVCHFWLSAMDQTFWFYFSPYCRIPEFALGALVAQIFVKLPLKMSPREQAIARLIGGTSASCIIAIFGLFLIARLSGRIELLQISGGYAPACAGLIYYLARTKGFATAVAEWTPFLLLGNASYSIYLLHPWILWLFSSQGVGDPLMMWSKIAVSLIFIALLSLGCYQYFERPARMQLRKLLQR